VVSSAGKDDAMAQPLIKPQEETRSSYAKRIRDLVEFEYVEGARRLVAEAIRQEGETEELLSWQRVLGPARHPWGPSDELAPDRTPEFDWLREYDRHYQGQWVALAEGRLLAHSRDLQEVESALETIKPSRRPFIHFIEWSHS
jgi:uncharacterized protein DUF5678